MKALIDDSRMVGKLLGTDFGMLLENRGHEKSIERLPITLNPGERVYPGTQFTKIGSSETSACSQPIYMNEGCWFEYLGIIRTLDGNLAVFRQQPNNMDDKYFPCYWYFQDEDGGHFIWFTQACAGRAVKLRDCEYEVAREVIDA